MLTTKKIGVGDIILLKGCGKEEYIIFKQIGETFFKIMGIKIGNFKEVVRKDCTLSEITNQTTKVLNQDK